jgi:hypothetical protein
LALSAEIANLYQTLTCADDVLSLVQPLDSPRQVGRAGTTFAWLCEGSAQLPSAARLSFVMALALCAVVDVVGVRQHMAVAPGRPMS